MSNKCTLVCILLRLCSVRSNENKAKMPGSKSGACKWNDALTKDFPGITAAKNGKPDHFHCTHCRKDLSLHHKGRKDIESHIQTNEHQKNVKSIAGTPTLDRLFNGEAYGHFLCFYFLGTNIIDFIEVNTKANLDDAAKEAVWCYHKVKSGQSFRSSDCESEIIRSVFKQDQFHLGHTKCASIASNVFAPKIVAEVKDELKTCNFVSIATDASNHNAIKMFPVVGRWFSPVNGLK